MRLTRRTALGAITGPLLFGGAGLTVAGSASAAKDAIPRLPKGGRILFQGDSITDGGRGHGSDPNHIFGQDYAYILAAQRAGRYPAQNWTFFNRGVSGNKVTDLAARWQEDALALKPDLLSILIGVNDAGSVVYGGASGVTVEQYEQVYDQLTQLATRQPSAVFRSQRSKWRKQRTWRVFCSRNSPP